MYNRLSIRNEVMAALRTDTSLAGWEFVDGLEGVQVSQEVTDKKVYVQIRESEIAYDDSRSEDWTVRDEIPERGVVLHEMTFFVVHGDVNSGRDVLEEFVAAFPDAIAKITLGEKPNQVFFRVGSIDTSHKDESNDELRNVLIGVQAAQQLST